MAEINLNNQHPDYQATSESRTRSRDLFEGWRAVKPKTVTYLFKEARETDPDYEVRLARAVVDNWVERIVLARQSVIFRKAVQRELSEALRLIAENVDRMGTKAESFFQEVCREAQIDGIRWVAVDMPVAPEKPFNSRAEEKANRHRVFFESVPANSVIDWEPGADGQLDWAVVQLSVAKPRPAAGQAVEVVGKYKVWYRDKWEVLVAGEKGAITVESTGPNTSGVVPLVPFFGVKRTDYSGWPVVDPLLEHIILIYNKRSDLDRSERVAAHPMPVFMAPEKPEFVNMSNGMWLDTTSANGNPVDAKMLEPSGVAFDSIRASIGLLEQTIRAHALAQAKKDSAQVESAEAQREYKENFNSSIRSASVLYEGSELRCWEIAALWTADKGLNTVKYNRDFDDAAIEQAMVKVLYELTGSKPAITTRTLLETLVKGELLDPTLDIDKELKDLESEEAQATAALAKSLVPVAQTMPPEPST